MTTTVILVLTFAYFLVQNLCTTADAAIRYARKRATR